MGFKHIINQTINETLDALFASSVPGMYTTCGELSDHHVLLAEKKFPRSYPDCEDTVDYIKLKAKEFILHELLIQISLLYDDANQYYISLSDAFKAYFDLKDGNIEKVIDTWWFHFQSFGNKVSEGFKEDYELFGRVKSTVLHKDEKKNLVDDRKKKFFSVIKAFNFNPDPEYANFLTEEGFDIKPNTDNLSTFKKRYDSPFEDSLFIKNMALLYLHFHKNEVDKLSDMRVPEILSPYICLLISEFQINGNLFKACRQTCFTLEEENADIPSSIENVSRYYTEHCDEAIQIMQSLSDIDTMDDFTILTNEIFLNKLLHYEFFHPKNDRFLRYILGKVSINSLLKFCKEDEAFKAGKANTHPKTSYQLDESFFYFSLLQHFMLFNIDLSVFDTFEILPSKKLSKVKKIVPKRLCRGYAYLKKKIYKKPYLGFHKLHCEDSQRMAPTIIDMPFSILVDSFSTFSNHLKFIKALNVFLHFLEAVVKETGKTISYIFENNDIDFTSTVQVDNLRQSCLSILKDISNRDLYKELLFDSKGANPFANTTKPEVFSKAITDFKRYNRDELHTLCTLLYSNAFLQIPWI